MDKRIYFDEETDRRLLEAKSKEEVMAIIATTPAAAKLADKADLIIAEISRLKNSVDEEIGIDDIDEVAGGAKCTAVYLSESEECVATFYLEDMTSCHYCWSNDQCGVASEFEYHYTKYSNCRKGGKHIWVDGEYRFMCINGQGTPENYSTLGHECQKCQLRIEHNKYWYNS